MKTKLFSRILLLLMCLFSLISCNDENKAASIHHLSFEKSYYERPLIEAKDIMIRSGNRDYTIEIENPSILDVTIDLSSPVGMGDLKIYPKQKGETNLIVKDNVTDEIVNLKIKIIDSYLNLSVANPISFPYKQENEFFFINNKDKDFYLYSDKEMVSSHTGNYKFLVENNIPYMELTFHKDFEGRKTYKYNLAGTSQTMFYVLKSLLNWNWSNTVESPTTKEIYPIVMRATDIETNTTYYLAVGRKDIPEHVLN